MKIRDLFIIRKRGMGLPQATGSAGGRVTAEEKRRDVSFHAGGWRNEALDCRVYAMCAGDVFLDLLVLDYKAGAKKRGATPEQFRDIDHRFVLDVLKKEIE